MFIIVSYRRKIVETTKDIYKLNEIDEELYGLKKDEMVIFEKEKMTIAQRRWRLMWGNPCNHYRINENAIEYR